MAQTGSGPKEERIGYGSMCNDQKTTHALNCDWVLCQDPAAQPLQESPGRFVPSGSAVLQEPDERPVDLDTPNLAYVIDQHDHVL